MSPAALTLFARLRLLCLLACLLLMPSSCSTLTEIGPASSGAIVDVRTHAAFRNSHASGARHIPLAELSSRSAQLHRYRAETITVYGATQSQAQQAKLVLLRKGFQSVNAKVWNN